VTLAAASRPVDQAPTWRREPYRLLFAAGALLGAIGVVPWLAFALGRHTAYDPVGHAVVQIQGFVSCFVAGFLMTMIPRRTGTPAPAGWQLALALALPAIAAGASLTGRVALGQAAWLGFAAVLAGFGVPRFRSAARPAPNAFVWLPLSLLTGAAGSALTLADALAPLDFGMRRFATLLLTQGFLLGLILGVGSLVLPLMTRGESPPDGTNAPRDRAARLAHGAAWLALVGSFALEAGGWPVAGRALRGVLTLALLLVVPRLYRLPSVPGEHRRLLWLAPWCLPLGCFVAALWPDRPQLGQHLVFLGGFALLTLMVGAHVVLAHGGRPHLVATWTWPVRGAALALAVALAARLAAEVDRLWYSAWLGVAAAAFLVACACWLALLLPRRGGQAAMP
jgi:uncharacterized protein involved in response to NO